MRILVKCGISGRMDWAAHLAALLRYKLAECRVVLAQHVRVPASLQEGLQLQVLHLPLVLHCVPKLYAQSF
jgi:hypothetical protein